VRTVVVQRQVNAMIVVIAMIAVVTVAHGQSVAPAPPAPLPPAPLSLVST
jgi:hypothetical protein